MALLTDQEISEIKWKKIDSLSLVKSKNGYVHIDMYEVENGYYLFTLLEPIFDIKSDKHFNIYNYITRLDIQSCRANHTLFLIRDMWTKYTTFYLNDKSIDRIVNEIKNNSCEHIIMVDGENSNEIDCYTVISSDLQESESN